MSFKLRLKVPMRFFLKAGVCWVLLFTVLSAARTSSSLRTQFWSTDCPTNYFVVPGDSDSAKVEAEDILELSVDLCTAIEQSCDSNFKMSNITTEQKQILKSLYREGGKSIKTEFHIEFLNKSLEQKVIPKAFKIKNNLPGNINNNQKKMESIS